MYVSAFFFLFIDACIVLYFGDLSSELVKKTNTTYFVVWYGPKLENLLSKNKSSEKVKLYALKILTCRTLEKFK